MQKQTEVDVNIFQHLRNYWVIYLFIVNMIITFTTTSTRLNALEAQAAKNEITQDQQNQVELDIRTQLASINTNIEYLKRNNNK